MVISVSFRFQCKGTPGMADPGNGEPELSCGGMASFSCLTVNEGQ